MFHHLFISINNRAKKNIRFSINYYVFSYAMVHTLILFSSHHNVTCIVLICALKFIIIIYRMLICIF